MDGFDIALLTAGASGFGSLYKLIRGAISATSTSERNKIIKSVLTIVAVIGGAILGGSLSEIDAGIVDSILVGLSAVGVNTTVRDNGKNKQQ